MKLPLPPRAGCRSRGRYTLSIFWASLELFQSLPADYDGLWERRVSRTSQDLEVGSWYSVRRRGPYSQRQVRNLYAPCNQPLWVCSPGSLGAVKLEMRAIDTTCRHALTVNVSHQMLRYELACASTTVHRHTTRSICDLVLENLLKS